MKRVSIQLPVLTLPGGHSIQPVDPGTDCAREAARLERLIADRKLVDRVMWAGYAGPEWRQLSTALVEYGVGVLRVWIVSGRIFVECAHKGFGGIKRRRRNDEDEADGLAGETVARALIYFRDRVLIAGLWDPTKGATLKTYFIGACLHHFPNEYARSQGGEDFEDLLMHGADANDVLTEVIDPSPYSRPDRRVELVRTFDGEVQDSFVREALLDEVEGYTQDDTARRLNTSRWTIEGRLRRFGHDPLS
jgi:hypothetical protein